MYVLSHGCLLISCKAFFHLHTWFFLSCDFTSSGCKCLFLVYAFFSWEASCYESCLVSHDVSIYCMMELQTSFHVSILHPRHHSSWTIILHKLEGFASMMSLYSSYYSSFWNVVTCSSEQVLHYSLLVGDYVCNFSYKSNAFVWLETFHKEYSYWKILMHKCNYFSQYNIHPYLTETF